MSKTIQKRLFSLLAVPFFAIQLAATAAASNDVLYPDNPYSGRVSWTTGSRTVAQPPRTQPLPNYAWHEYPQGPNGPRIVEVVLSQQELTRARNQLLGRVQAKVRATSADLRTAQDRIADRRQRLRWIEPYRNASPEHFDTWSSLYDEVQDLDDFIVEAEKYLGRCRAYENYVRRLFSNPRPTRVFVTVLNHRNRQYVPTSYLRIKAVEHVQANAERVGSTLRMNF